MISTRLRSPTAPETKTDETTGYKKGHLNGGPEQSTRQVSGGRKAVSSPSKPILDAEASAALRDQLAAEPTDLRMVRRSRTKLSSVQRIEEKNSNGLLLLTGPYWRCRRRAGFAIGIMSNQSPSNRACSAVGVPPMPIICDLRNHGRLAARRAMSSLSLSVGDIIAKCIIAVINPPGGIRRESIRPSPLARCATDTSASDNFG
jgi:hypothetical protein